MVTYRARFTICLRLTAAISPAASGIAIPDFVIRVSAHLFDIGLADPRGGDYREVAPTIPYDDKPLAAVCEEMACPAAQVHFKR